MARKNLKFCPLCRSTRYSGQDTVCPYLHCSSCGSPHLDESLMRSLLHGTRYRCETCGKLVKEPIKNVPLIELSAYLTPYRLCEDVGCEIKLFLDIKAPLSGRIALKDFEPISLALQSDTALRLETDKQKTSIEKSGSGIFKLKARAPVLPRSSGRREVKAELHYKVAIKDHVFNRRFPLEFQVEVLEQSEVIEVVEKLAKVYTSTELPIRIIAEELMFTHWYTELVLRKLIMQDRLKARIDWSRKALILERRDYDSRTQIY